MMHSKNISENQWDQVKSEIQKTWNRLDSDELEQTHGDLQAISDLVQKRYALDKDQAERKIDEVIDRCGTQAGPATFNKSSSSSSVSSSSASRSANAASAGPASVGSNVDPSSLSASINQDSSMKSPRSSSSMSRDTSTNFRSEADEQSEDIVRATSFDAPEEGLDSAFATGGMESPERDSRAPEDFNTNEPKFYGSEGQVNGSRSEERQAGNSRRSENSEGSTGSARGSQTFEKSARNSEGKSSAKAGDSRTSSARDTRSSEDSAEE